MVKKQGIPVLHWEQLCKYMYILNIHAHILILLLLSNLIHFNIDACIPECLITFEAWAKLTQKCMVSACVRHIENTS